MVIPAAFSISLSASRKPTFKKSDSLFPMEDLNRN